MINRSGKTKSMGQDVNKRWETYFWGGKKALKGTIMNNELGHSNVKIKDGINTNNALMPS